MLGRAFIPQRSGKVIVTASIAGLRGNPPHMPTIAYNAAKGADVNFVRALAAEWGRYNINVNAICPGFFPSKMSNGLLQQMGEEIVAHTPLGRLGGEEDLKGAVVYLASEASRHVTGHGKEPVVPRSSSPAAPRPGSRKAISASRKATSRSPARTRCWCATTGSRSTPTCAAACRTPSPMPNRCRSAKSWSAAAPAKWWQSKHPKFAPGDKVVGALGWQLLRRRRRRRAAEGRCLVIPLSAYLGPVGMPGVTAWVGLNDICAPKAGETVVVTAASGAVGSVVGQLAKMKGARAVGIAGGAGEVPLRGRGTRLRRLHRLQGRQPARRPQAATPKGIDCLFENVGGEIFDTLLGRMNPFRASPSAASSRSTTRRPTRCRTSARC
jgi:hypothetical protein